MLMNGTVSSKKEIKSLVLLGIALLEAFDMLQGKLFFTPF